MLSVFDRNYNGRTIRIREDKYVCLTDMAAASGKLFADWARLKSTTAYLEALSETMGIPIVELIEVTEGREGGSWAHPRIAIKFAAWCCPKFEVQVTIWIDELMTTGTVALAPLTPLQLAKIQVELHEQLELQAEQIKQLEEETERQAEIIDELFDYSSIIRIAKYNQVTEKHFNWRKLKAASVCKHLEIKTAPCPRYGTKNLYHHDAWRYAYPNANLPETTTLVVQS